MKKEKCCCICGKTPLTKDEIGIVKKIIDIDATEFYCIHCLAVYLECEEQDIYDKIEDFKEDGCTLFI